MMIYICKLSVCIDELLTKQLYKLLGSLSPHILDYISYWFMFYLYLAVRYTI